MASEVDVESPEAMESDTSNRRVEEVRARDRARARDYYDRNQEAIRAKKRERLAALRAVEPSPGPGRPKAADRGGRGGMRVGLARPVATPAAAAVVSGASQEQ